MSIKDEKQRIISPYVLISIDKTNNLEKYKERELIQNLKDKIFITSAQFEYFRNLNKLDYQLLNIEINLINERYMKPVNTYILDYENTNIELNSIENDIYIGSDSKIQVSQLFLNESTENITGEPLLLYTSLTNKNIFNKEDYELFDDTKKYLSKTNHDFFIEDLKLLRLSNLCKDKNNNTYFLFSDDKNENIKLISTNDFNEIVNILNSVTPPVEENYLSFKIRF